MPPPDEDGTTSGVSGDGGSSGFQPEKPPPLFRLDEEEKVSHHSPFQSPSSSFQPHPTPQGTRHYDSYHHQHQQHEASPQSFIGEGSFSQSYETASYPGLKILVPRLGFNDEEDEREPTLAPSMLDPRVASPIDETGSVLSTLSNEESTDMISSNILNISIGILTTLVFAALAMVGTCFAGLCQPQSSSSIAAPQVFATLRPTPSPTRFPICLVTTQPTFQSSTTNTLDNSNALQRAVDLYLESLPVTPESMVAKRYGYPIGKWNVSMVEDLSNLFDSQRNPLAAVFNEDLSDWDTRRARDMSQMFRGAKRFNGDVTNFDTSSVTSMESMFEGALSFSQHLGDWDVRAVTTTEKMFLNAISFRGEGVDQWDLQSVEQVDEMVR